MLNDKIIKGKYITEDEINEPSSVIDDEGVDDIIFNNANREK